MTSEQPTARDLIILESIEVMRKIEAIFREISKATEDIEDESTIANIEGEREYITQRIISAVGNYHSPLSTLRETRELLGQALENENLLRNVDPYINMRLTANIPLAEGLLNYAQKTETAKIEDQDAIISFMLRPSSVMEVKGTLRKLLELHPTQDVYIEMDGIEVPMTIFTDNDFFIEDKTQKEVLIGKTCSQPRVQHSGFSNGTVVSPEIRIGTEDELETVLEGAFFDDYLALGIQKRITVKVQ